VEVGLDHVEAVCECKREGMEMMLGLYTDREGRRGSGKALAAARLPLMVGGPCGSDEGKKRGDRRTLEEGGGRGVYCLSLRLEEGRGSGVGAG
jgi:hypothetical protein